MDDRQVAALFRVARIRRRMRQEDVAAAAGASRAVVSRIERGQFASLPLDRLRSLAGVLDIRLGVVAHWRGGEASRVVNERHSRMHELVAGRLAGLPEWTFASEVTYSVRGERGVIDILAWHAPTRTLLVLELKTEITDPAGLVAQVDRYSRLAAGVARERGWFPLCIATWVIVAEADLNRRRLARHRTMLRNAFPLDGRFLRGWLRDPATGPVGGQAGSAAATHVSGRPGGPVGSGRLGAESGRPGGPAGGPGYVSGRPGGPAGGPGYVSGRPGGPAGGVARLNGLAFLAIERGGSANRSLGPIRRVRRGRNGSLRPTILVNAPQATHMHGKSASPEASGPAAGPPAGADHG